jgi:replication factor A1
MSQNSTYIQSRFLGRLQNLQKQGENRICMRHPNKDGMHYMNNCRILQEKGQNGTVLFQEILTKPRGTHLKHKKPEISEHLASLSVQYSVYPAELFQALVTARENKKATCQSLTVEYRGSVDGEAIFLIKQGDNVVVQFRVDEETLTQKNIAFDNWMDTDKIRKQIAKLTPAESVTASIRDLRHGMKKINLEAKVVKVEEPRMVHTQFGNNALLANALIEDDTGKIKLCLWDQQVNAVAVGDTVQIGNASVSTFKGEKQLRLGKTGTLTVTQKDAAKKAVLGQPKKLVCA